MSSFPSRVVGEHGVGVERVAEDEAVVDLNPKKNIFKKILIETFVGNLCGWFV